jgi:hypothetical protein
VWTTKLGARNATLYHEHAVEYHRGFSNEANGFISMSLSSIEY